MGKVQVEKLHTLTGHRDAIYTLQAAADPTIVFSAAGDGMVVKWDLGNPETGELIARLPNSIYALAYDSNTDLLIAGHNYDGIHLLDWKQKKEVGSLHLGTASVFDIRVVGREAIVAMGDGSLIKMDLHDLRVLQKVHLSSLSARALAIDKRSGAIAVGYSDHMIRVFDHQLKLVKEWKAHDNSVFTLAFMPNAPVLVSGSRDARLKFWNVNKDYRQEEEIVAHLYAINHLDFSPDGKHFVTCSMDRSVKVWSASELSLLKVIDKSRHAGHGTSVNKVVWTGMNNQVLSASDDRTISIWHIIF